MPSSNGRRNSRSAQKFSRLAARMRTPALASIRQNPAARQDAGSRGAGVAILARKSADHRVGLRGHGAPGGHAGDARRSDRQAKNPVINPLNTAWVLLGAFLVFGMQAGFTMLEAGFCRNRETVNVLVECVFDTCVCGLLHWGWGFAFMFGGGNAFIGWHMPGDPTKSLIFMKDVGVLSTSTAPRASRSSRTTLPVRLRRLRLDDLLGRDGRPDAVHRRRHLLHRRLGFHLSDLRPLVLGPRWLPRHHGHRRAISCRVWE